ncbi:BspA family leucine-rich repeat surface protein [Weissella coleopterorum]|uniref:BspA family leucine-rich repeat surface protein n=1 Tax=Weissella coleopterorum TaxID=2714949 RepID=A0A6G8B0W4_9LACO|nr:MucBP domain-containing protein [Weissella coleopterorum]QIL50862.1 BspA family leucine-rich repeat surface protein [Weissella coleopterorum]
MKKTVILSFSILLSTNILVPIAQADMKNSEDYQTRNSEMVPQKSELDNNKNEKINLDVDSKLTNNSISNTTNTSSSTSVNESSSVSDSVNMAEGTFGTSDWYITESGVLHIGQGTFNNTGYQSPWEKYSKSINKVIFDGKVSAASDISYLFYSFENVTSIDNLTYLDTSKVTNMRYMFHAMTNLQSLDLSNFNTLNVTDMFGMFDYCTNLTYLDLSSFNTSNVKNMSSMFSQTKKLTQLDISTFNTSNVTNMNAMFSETKSLPKLDLSSFNTGNVSDMSNMFRGASGLTSLDLSNFDTKKVTIMSDMFSGVSKISSLDLSEFKTENVTSMAQMFAGMTALNDLNVSNFNTNNVTKMNGTFYGDANLNSLDISSFNTSNVVTMVSMFAGMTNLKNINLDNFNTSKVTTMWSMFSDMQNVKYLNLQSFDTKNVTDMRGMFVRSGFTDINVSSFNTQNVANMNGMFEELPNLEKLNLDNFIITNNTNIKDMFLSDIELKEIVLGKNISTLLNSGIPEFKKSNKYTGKWQNVAEGNSSRPSGINVYSSEDLMSNYDGLKNSDTYVWQPVVMAANVTVHYQDVDGNKIADDEIKSGNIGDDYSTDKKDIKGYTFKKVEGDASGKLTDKAQTVTYVYTKDPVKAANVTVHYRDVDGNKIADDEIKSGNIGDDYSTDKKDIKGYTFKKVEGDASGKLTDKAQTVTYVYTKNPVKAANVTVHYRDVDGNKIADDEIKSGNIGDDYSTDKKDIKGYTFKKVEGDASGKLTDKAQTVTYVYTKNPVKAANVTVHYRDVDGNKIADDEIKSGNIGDDYSTDKKDIKGYTFKKVEGDASGKLTEKAQTVTYVYTKDPVKAANVTVHYQDVDGNKIADDEIKSGNIGDDYSTDKKDIKGYTFKKVEGDASGKLTEKAQTVTYVYTKDPVKAANVTVHYQDVDGNKIADDEIKSGNIGDDYSTDKKDIKGYTFKKVEGDASGKLTEKAQTVTYVYTKDPVKAANVTVHYQDVDGNKIADDEIKSGNIGDDYSTDKKDIKGYTFKKVEGDASGKLTEKAQTVTYVYTKDPVKAANVTVHYQDVDGNKIADDEIKSGNIGDDYSTDKKDIKGYTFKKVEGDASGKLTEKAQTVTYVYVSEDNKNNTQNNSDNANKDEKNSLNSTTKNIVSNAKNMLPNTAVQKVTLAGLISFILANLMGLLIWKKRK